MHEREHWAKRMKALDDCEYIAKRSEYALVLSGLRSSSNDTKTGESTSKGGLHKGEGTSARRG